MDVISKGLREPFEILNFCYFNSEAEKEIVFEIILSDNYFIPNAAMRFQCKCLNSCFMLLACRSPSGIV